MSSTRFQPLQIYQDPVDRAPMPPAQSSSLRKLSPLRPLKNAASRRNIVLDPPRTGVSKQSPSKSAYQNSSSPRRGPLGSSSKLNVVPMPPPRGSRYDTDSMEKKQPVMSKFKPQRVLFAAFSAQAPTDKENYPQQYYHASTNPYSEGLNRASFSLEGVYGQKPPQKRTLLEAAPINESRPLKRAKVEDQQDVEEAPELMEIPAPDSFPPLHDNGAKPTHSYAQLIGMSILRAPNRRLTLAQIYKWISDTYSFYSATDAGWQNSIRHNLSLNKAFIKQERPKDDPGKGNYWAIKPGMEYTFIKEKPQPRKAAGQSQNAPSQPANPPPVSVPEVAQFKAPVVPPAPELPQSQAPHKQYPALPESSQLPAIPELSSDATIPASDALLTDPEGEEDDAQQAPSSPLIQSSPPAMMNSSPPAPVSRQPPKRNNTPPPVPRFPSSSRSRSRKRKYASMDDSGYFSSLDSSAMRPNRLLSDADRPRIKRGRAEEEIARLRGSSYDSPTKSRTFIPPSSSPLRVERSAKPESSQMLPPLTPVVKLKAPTRPPPSVSPNTNLRMHRDRVREMVGSPLRGMTVLDENQPWSPAFQLDDSSTACMFGDFTADFDIFADPGSFLSVPGNGSPEKRSAKRPRLDRSKSTNILGDISHSNFNKALSSTPLLKLTPPAHHSSFSPLKGFGLMESPSKLLGIDSPSRMPSPTFSLSGFDLPQDDLCAQFLSEEVSEGWDIMQGFQKIGGGSQSSHRSTPKQGSRPSMSRSFTSRF